VKRVKPCRHQLLLLLLLLQGITMTVCVSVRSIDRFCSVQTARPILPVAALRALPTTTYTDYADCIALLPCLHVSLSFLLTLFPENANFDEEKFNLGSYAKKAMCKSHR